MWNDFMINQVFKNCSRNLKDLEEPVFGGPKLKYKT